MKVLLISPNKEHLPDPVFPIGLAYIASSLIKHGHDVRTLDLCFSEDMGNSIKSTISEFSPEIIGMSLRNIDDVAYPKRHSFISEYKDVMRVIRSSTDVPVVLGGSGFTIMPDEFMSELKADYGIIGEGENAFPRLLKNINKTDKLYSHKLKSLDDLIPERSLFDMEAYYRFGGMLNIQTKRGCGFRCIYCTYPQIEGNKIRLRSPRKVVDEIKETVSGTGIRHYFIVDSIFNYPSEHAAEICREIIKRSVDIKWSCYCSPAGMTRELIELMINAGCTAVEFGTDSLNDKSLALLGKAFNFKNIRDVSVLCRDGGLKFCHFVFVGAPGDTLKDVRENIEKLDEIKPDAAVIMAGIRIFPKTKLAEMAAMDLGIKNIGLDPVFYISPEVSDNLESISDEAAKRRNWVMPGFEIHIYDRLQRKLRESGVKGSLLEELSKRCQ